MPCPEAALRYRQRLLDIAETKTGKKILESMKKISKSKGSDYLRHEEVSKESGIKDRRVESVLEKLSEVGIVIRNPVYVGTDSRREVNHYEYRLPVKTSVKEGSIVFIDLNKQKEPDDSKVREYVV